MKKREAKLYPFEWHDKVYKTEDDVDSLFAAFYWERDQGFPIYIGDGFSIYPDGTYEDDELK